MCSTLHLTGTQRHNEMMITNADADRQSPHRHAVASTAWQAPELYQPRLRTRKEHGHRRAQVHAQVHAACVHLLKVVVAARGQAVVHLPVCREVILIVDRVLLALGRHLNTAAGGAGCPPARRRRR